MGAPGDAFLCGNGHVVDYIGDDMHWDDSLHEYAEECRKRVCPCGSPVKFDIPHYGDINDCLENPLPEMEPDTFKVERQFQRYDVSNLTEHLIPRVGEKEPMA